MLIIIAGDDHRLVRILVVQGLRNSHQIPRVERGHDRSGNAIRDASRRSVALGDNYGRGIAQGVHASSSYCEAPLLTAILRKPLRPVLLNVLHGPELPIDIKRRNAGGLPVLTKEDALSRSQPLLIKIGRVHILPHGRKLSRNSLRCVLLLLQLCRCPLSLFALTCRLERCPILGTQNGSLRFPADFLARPVIFGITCWPAIHMANIES